MIGVYGEEPRFVADLAFRERLIGALRRGMTHGHACGIAGIAREKFYIWLAKGRGGEEPYQTLLREVEYAESAFASEQLATIRAAAEGRRKDDDSGQPARAADWQAAAWLLERRYRHDFGRATIIQDGGKLDVAVPDGLMGMTPAQLEAIVRARPRELAEARPARASPFLDIESRRVAIRQIATKKAHGRAK